MKKLIILVLVCSLTFSIGFNLKVNADNEVSEINTSAQSAYVCDYNSGTKIYSKNENDRKPIASMTKIMLLLLAFEKNANGQFDFKEKITISERASSMGGSQVFLQANKDYTAEDLIKSIIVASANDASVAIAERLFGSEENAVIKMNEKCKNLKLVNTLFSNCTGLPKPTQYSSAKDVSVMLSELIKYEKYFEFSKVYLDEIVHPDGKKTALTNTNKLVRFYSGCDGGKTGFTNESGYCLAATAKRGNLRIISVLINEPNSKTRFADCSSIFNYAFANYEAKQVLSKTQMSDIKAKVNCGKQDKIDVFPERDFYIFARKNQKQNLKIDLKLDKESFIAPLKFGYKLGVYSVYKDGILVGEVNAISKTSVEKANVIDIVKEIAAG